MIKNTRYLSDKEIDIIVALIDAGNSNWFHLKKALSSIIVTDMNDGDMGSVQFEAISSKVRKLGVVVSEAEFIDSDGITVSIVLNLDEENRLFELDIWKVDFNKLLTLPDVTELKFKT